MIYYVRYTKVKNGYKAEGYSRIFKSVFDLKSYFEKTSNFKVKFIRY